MPQRLIASFVVRVVHERQEHQPAKNPVRVTVRHVQTGEEIRFARLTDALSFMEGCAGMSDECGDTDLGELPK